MDAVGLLSRRWIDPISGCWEWTGCRNGEGYGRVRFRGRTENVHRAALRLLSGLEVDGLEVRHLCDNPPCFNPDHLRAGTHAENMREMFERERRRHARGERHGRAKLSELQVREIRSRATASVAMADEFDVSYSTIKRIRRGEIWAHI